MVYPGLPINNGEVWASRSPEENEAGCWPAVGYWTSLARMLISSCEVPPEIQTIVGWSSTRVWKPRVSGAEMGPTGTGQRSQPMAGCELPRMLKGITNLSHWTDWAVAKTWGRAEGNLVDGVSSIWERWKSTWDPTAFSHRVRLRAGHDDDPNGSVEMVAGIISIMSLSWSWRLFLSSFWSHEYSRMLPRIYNHKASFLPISTLCYHFCYLLMPSLVPSLKVIHWKYHGHAWKMNDHNVRPLRFAIPNNH